MLYHSKDCIPQEVKRAFSSIYTNQYDPIYRESEYITTQTLLKIMFEDLDMCAISKTGKPVQPRTHVFNDILCWMGFQYWHTVYETWQPNTAFPMLLYQHPKTLRVFVNGVRKKRVCLRYNKNIIVPFMATFQEQTNMFARPSEF